MFGRDRRSFNWACGVLKNASLTDLESLWITLAEELYPRSRSARVQRSLIPHPNTDHLLKGLMLIKQLRSISFDFFKRAVSSETKVVTEDDFKSFMDLLLKCFLRVVLDLDYALNVDDSLNRLKSENFLRFLYKLNNECYAESRNVAATAYCVELALRVLNWHPISLKKLTDSMIATINRALKFEASVRRISFERISLLSSALKPNSLLWELHEDSRKSLVSEWPSGVSLGDEHLLDRLVRVTRNQEAINRIKAYYQRLTSPSSRVKDALL